MIFNERHHNHVLKYLKPTAILSQDESARYLQYFQIYDASINFDPKNVSIVKTLDRKNLAHLTIELRKNFRILKF